jgi:hypothetical protein
MASQYDPSDFVDSDFESGQPAAPVSGNAPGSGLAPVASRPPTQEELDAKVNATYQRLAELKRAQEALERERSALEEARRRQAEFQNGRQEMIQNLTRGIGLLTESEFNARRDAEQMAKTLVDFRDALAKVQDINPDNWTQDNYNVELTRALTTIENARMEWNASRLKFTVLAGEEGQTGAGPADAKKRGALPLQELGFMELGKVGLALSWPFIVAILAGFVVLGLMLGKH